MKKAAITILTTLTFLTVTMTACGNAASSGTHLASDTQGAPSTAALSTETKLIVGTFKLEGTDLAVTPKEAGELLPLWQVYSELASSDTAAQEEITALVEQIQDTMTPEQVQAIEDMQLTRNDVFTLMQEQGVTTAGGQRTGEGNNSGSAFQRGNIPEGGFPPGGLVVVEGGPGEGGQGGAGRSFSPEQIATAQASRGQGGGLNLTPSALIKALIQLLETKTQS
jgi:hypothetical protein